jgi:restriction system protein
MIAFTGTVKLLEQSPPHGGFRLDAEYLFIFPSVHYDLTVPICPSIAGVLMAVPDFQSFMLPMLQLLSDGAEHSVSELRERLASEMHLTDVDLEEKLPSGVQTKYSNRVYWSTVYLAKAGAIVRVRRGVISLAERGKQLLAENHSKITVKILKRFPEFLKFQTKESANSNIAAETAASPAIETETPEERLESSFVELQASLAGELLDSVKKCPPEFFEQLVIKLLVAMGYGGSLKDAGKAVGRPGDDGIDGIIKEDKLGLDVVYIQAKRWTNRSVGRPEVQAFVGSLEGHRAQKGIIITTPFFSPDALEYVQRIGKRIVSVDGDDLAELMIEHDIGVSASKNYQLKRIDHDFFELD